MSSKYRFITHDISSVSGGSLQDGSTISETAKYFIPGKLIKGNYISISYFAKPSSGTMTPKFRLYSKETTFAESSLGVAKWARHTLITPKDADGNTIAVSDTTNGQTIKLAPILVGDQDLALLLEDCETGGQLIIAVERHVGGLL